MNKRRGFKRLAVALAVPYFGWWALIAAIGYGRLNDPNGNANQYASANEQLGAALFWGVLVPIFVLIVAAVAYWVYRGFRQK